jgi:hypothetical protein
MRTIRLDGVPDEVVERLGRLAARGGLPLEDHLRPQLTVLARAGLDAGALPGLHDSGTPREPIVADGPQVHAKHGAAPPEPPGHGPAPPRRPAEP